VTREEKIMKRMREHYERGVELYGESRIVGLFLQGSQNYGLDYENSDIDTKLIITPTLEDIIFNRKPVSTTHVMENEEHLDAKDIRLYIQTFRKQNLNFLEILFTEFKIVNPQYEKMWNVLVEHREEIARYNEFQAIKSMKGIAMEKYHAMEHPYPSKVDIINTYGYDGKQVHHLLRVEDYIERYIKGESYASCLYPRLPEYLKDVKVGCHSLETARSLADNAIENINKMCNEYLEICSKDINQNVDILLDDVQYNIMKIAIKKEIGD
jgi:hypothetical protein